MPRCKSFIVKIKVQFMDRIFNNCGFFHLFSPSSVFNYWFEFFSTSSPVVGELPNNVMDLEMTVFGDLLSFITINEVLNSFPPLKSGVGLDGVSAAHPDSCPCKTLYSLV